jgi:diguanylate cyclase (GGDEF)-like protein
MQVPVATEDPLFDSYLQLAQGQLGPLSGACLLDAEWRVRGLRGELAAGEIVTRLEALRWSGTDARLPALECIRAGHWLTLVPLEHADGVLLGAFCVQQSLAGGPPQLNRHAAEVARRLQPLTACICRDLLAALPTRERIRTLTERTEELEWLFEVTGKLTGRLDDRGVIEELLAAATRRLGGTMCVLEIPEKRLCVEYFVVTDAPYGTWHQREMLKGVWKQTRQNLLQWAQRRNQPLVVNSAGRSGDKIPRCKILSVPVARHSGRVIGYLGFYNPPFADDFTSRHVFLARHLGRQAASLVDSQFDLMTGLYNRDGLLQTHAARPADAEAQSGCVLYVDIDHMQVVNELHGFELGNELIVRVAELLGPPLMPERAIAARLSGDRFVVVLPDAHADAGRAVAERMQAAARRLRLGPSDGVVQVSLSCGIADLVAMPQGLDRAIAAAEIACKSAKSHGRDRVALYRSDDSSMMRRHQDAIAVGRLRAALNSDRLVLYAERIAPLGNAAIAGGYQVSLRVRESDGSLASIEPLLAAAGRYQLCPSVDRRLLQLLLEALTPYRRLLQDSGLWVAARVAAASLADAAFGAHWQASLRTARLPAAALVLMLDGDAAGRHLAPLAAMTDPLGACGCRYGLEDFGLATHAVGTIAALEVARVGIDAGPLGDARGLEQSAASVRAIVELGRRVGVETVAGGIVAGTARAALGGLGVDYGWGPAVGAPEPLEPLLRRLGSDESQRLRRLYLET